ncbi:hypothetical protein QLQ12_44135 [Actinoplanes sp. NEAU-A12]|uniref:Uncharacterized protein n=1 Tax=Actinoplanes sandaracinus TaxID=3045177 RepID=A0ABT6X0W2_9ACTN|nr:hypothetical protein [Actinoplanes sandaracinus]MDI6105592.1 hypothetical protein [Actinoplanes sandaracinus]
MDFLRDPIVWQDEEHPQRGFPAVRAKPGTAVWSRRGLLQIALGCFGWLLVAVLWITQGPPSEGSYLSRWIWLAVFLSAAAVSTTVILNAFMKRSWGVAMVTLALAATAVVATTRHSPQSDHTGPYGKAPKSLPALEALAREHVTHLAVHDWCRAYSDNRERRADQGSRRCPDGYKPFGDASEKRFSELRRKLDAFPYDVSGVAIEYGPSGEIRTATLTLDTIYLGHEWLTYDPGYTLPRDIPRERGYHRIDSDWYHGWEDWN